RRTTCLSCLAAATTRRTSSTWTATRCIAGIIAASRAACSTRRWSAARAGTCSETGMIPGMPALFKNKTIGELDWDGNIVWQWGVTAPGGAAQQHHDWARLPNGDTLVLSVLSYQIPGFTLPKQLDDAIYEVTPNGDIVWKWIAGDHLDEF